MHLFDGHATGDRPAVWMVRHLVHIVLLLLVDLTPLTGQVWLQPFAKVGCDGNGDANGGEYERNGEGGKSSEGLAHREVLRHLVAGPYPNQLENEIGGSGTVKDLESQHVQHNQGRTRPKRTITMSIPKMFSRRAHHPARSKKTMVRGMAATVIPNSGSSYVTTTATNWTENPRKKKKSNFRRAM